MSEMERMALDNLRRNLDMEIHSGTKARKKFAKAVRDFAEQIGVDEEYVVDYQLDEYFLRMCSRVPDGYAFQQNKINPEVIDLIFIEVEDTHPMPSDKLLDYANYWFDTDSTDNLTFSVLVTDRYGMDVKQLPLQDIWYAEIYPNL